MRRLISFLIAFSLLLALAGCTAQNIEPELPTASAEIEESSPAAETPPQEEQLDFLSLSDPNLLSYVEDAILAETEALFSSDDYRVECVLASYISKEYLDELEFNSKGNVYFGYTLQEIENQFAGTKYVFTLGDEGETIVQPFKTYDTTFNQVIRNVAIGSGTILVCVTVSALSGAAGATTISTIFAASAKTGTTFALSSGGFAAVTTGIVTGIITGDVESAVKAAALSGSESFMWGAITGEITGGVSKALDIHRIDTTRRSPIESEKYALEQYGGREQVAYLNGEEVAYGTKGATRPDVVRIVDGKIEAIEVKNYDLNSPNGLQNLSNELKRQVSARSANLPDGSLQRVALDIHGQKLSEEAVNTAISTIQNQCASCYPNLPVDVWR